MIGRTLANNTKCTICNGNGITYNGSLVNGIRMWDGPLLKCNECFGTGRKLMVSELGY